MNSNERFSKKNKDILVKIPEDKGFIKFFKFNLAGPIIDFFPLILMFVWNTLAIQYINSINLFIVIEALLIIINLIFLYYVFIKFNRIEKNYFEIKINNLKKPYEFIFISDIHLGKGYPCTNIARLKRIVDIINKIDVELVVYGGDFLNYFLENKLLLELNNINKKNQIGVYGNHDAYYQEDNSHAIPQKFLEFFKKNLKIKLLVNEGIAIKNEDSELYFGGIPDLYSKKFDLNVTFKNSSDKSIKILLSHNPDIINFIEDKDNIDLILSGHNHSGQIYIKPFGAILPMPTLNKWLTKGIFDINKRTKLILSQGIGHSGSRLRIGTKNEICIIKLTSI